MKDKTVTQQNNPDRVELPGFSEETTDKLRMTQRIQLTKDLSGTITSPKDCTVHNNENADASETCSEITPIDGWGQKSFGGVQ